MLLARVAAASADTAATASRSAKVGLVAACLREVAPDEAATVVAYLAGELPQRRTGVGWAALRALPAPAGTATLTVTEVDVLLGRLALVTGTGSQAERTRLLTGLFARATDAEQRLLRGLLTGDLRQGALEGVMAEAVGRAAGIPVADVRRAAMLRGSLGPVAAAALTAGPAGLAQFRLEVGRPVQPMLASPASDLAAAMGRVTPAAVEYKLDGIRIQAHRSGDDVAVFTRSLEDVTARLPEAVEVVRALPVDAVVLDGEALSLDGEDRPRPFQQTASRTSSRVDVVSARAATPVSPFFFDVLHLDGTDLLGAPGSERFRALRRSCRRRRGCPGS